MNWKFWKKEEPETPPKGKYITKQMAVLKIYIGDGGGVLTATHSPLEEGVTARESFKHFIEWLEDESRDELYSFIGHKGETVNGVQRKYITNYSIHTENYRELVLPTVSG